MKTGLVAWGLALLAASPWVVQDLAAQEFDTSFDTSFEAKPATAAAEAPPEGQAATAAFYGFAREELGYAPNKEELNLAKLRTTLNLTYDEAWGGEWKSKVNLNAFYDAAYGLNGSDKYSPEVLDSLEQEVELRDTYLEGPLTDWLSVKAGRQIIAWGNSEVSQMNDLANPRDNRELGMVALEDARIPVGAVKWTVGWGNNEFNLVTLHEFRANKMPAQGSEFDVIAPVRSQAKVQEPVNPEAKLETLARLKLDLGGSDFYLFYADVYQDSFTLDFKSYDSVNQVLTLTPVYLPIKSKGAAFTTTVESWLFRVEWSQKENVPYQRADGTTQLAANITGIVPPSDGVYDQSTGLISSYSLKTVNQLSGGVEYNGFSDLTLTLEGALDQVQDWEANLTSPETGGVAALIASYSALNDALTNYFIWYHFTDVNGEVYRLQSDYNIIDAVTLGGGVALYQEQKDDGLLYPFRDNDRVFVTGKYSF